SELQPEPTESVLSEDLILRDEFDEDINNNWGLKIVSGLEDQLIWSQNNGKFRLEIQPPNDTNYAFFRKDTSYSDVTVQAEVENYGQLDNAFSLMCRATEAGWYELRISSQGYYELLRYDQYLADEGKNAYTNFVESRIGSTLIKSGEEVNVFALSCEGNQLKVFINGEQVYYDKRPLTIEDTTYPEGTIGFGVLSYGKEVDVTFNYIETLKP
ncbi:MAG: hypothetical protein ACYC59_10500, partial [Anaerolineaceae bacterium]